MSAYGTPFTNKFAKCGNCDWHGREEFLGCDFDEIPDLDERLDYPLGHLKCVEPIGECPECGSLAYEADCFGNVLHERKTK